MVEVLANNIGLLNARMLGCIIPGASVFVASAVLTFTAFLKVGCCLICWNTLRRTEQPL